MVEEGGKWDEGKLDAIFNSRDKQLINSIPLSLCGLEDNIAWAFEADGNYTVKTGYRVGCGGPNIQMEEKWKSLWKFKLYPKINYFCWQIFSFILPVRKELERRHIMESGLCPRCEREEETITHALFQCPNIRVIWENIGSSRGVMVTNDGEVVDILSTWLSSGKEEHLQFLLICWFIWFFRNKLTFDHVMVPSEVVLAKASALRDELTGQGRESKPNEAHMHTGPARANSQSKLWKSPPTEWVKVNSDARLGDNSCSVAAVIRRFDGQVSAAGAKKWDLSWNPFVAEAAGVLYAIKLALRMGFAKRLSLGENWLIYEGEEKVKPKFSVMKHVTIRQSKMLARMITCTAQSLHSYTMEGSYAHRRCTIFDERRHVMAELQRKETACGVALGGDVFRLVVKSRFDTSLAMAIVILLDQIFES